MNNNTAAALIDHMHLYYAWPRYRTERAIQRTYHVVSAAQLRGVSLTEIAQWWRSEGWPGCDERRSRNLVSSERIRERAMAARRATS